MNIIMNALGEIDEKYLEEVQNFKKKPNILKLTLPIAACFVVLSCFALNALTQTSQSDDAPALDTTAATAGNATDGASSGSTQDVLLFEYLGEVVEVFEDNTAIIRITQTDLSLEMYDELFFDVGDEVIVNFAVNSSVKVGDLVEFTHENYFILEGEIYEIDEENYS
ncbi:MAG: hypothetical protein R3Y27_01655 [Clostridia bacterium]